MLKMTITTTYDNAFCLWYELLPILLEPAVPLLIVQKRNELLD
jgi:hypothetical protein